MHACGVFCSVILHTRDTGKPKMTPEMLHWQQTVMDKFLMIDGDRTEALDRFGLIQFAQYATNPCEWLGVQCESREIKTIYWSRGLAPSDRIRLESFNTAWLPPSLEMVCTSDQPSKAAFSTRHMPRRLTYIEMNTCALHGSLDLTILPKFLSVMHMEKNTLHGTLKLTNLPRGLRSLKLQNNCFKLLVVRNAALPGLVKEYNFMNQNKRLKVMCLDDEHARPGIMY